MRKDINRIRIVHIALVTNAVIIIALVATLFRSASQRQELAEQIKYKDAIYIEETRTEEGIVEEVMSASIAPAEVIVTEAELVECYEQQWQWELLAMCVQAEAGNQDLQGKRMVADVVLNRVDDPSYPDTIEEVITQKYQFTTYWNGMIDAAVPDEETYQAVRLELESRSYPSLIYFNAHKYSDYGTPWSAHGDHYFSIK